MEIMKKLKEKLFKVLLKSNLKRVRKTQPIHCCPTSDVAVVTQVYHDALDMTLVALKSFIIEFGDVDLHVVDDGSLTEADKHEINKHLPNCRIIGFEEIDLCRCPQGGTWERLVYILNICVDKYVIQVDTDTVTTGSLSHVKSLVEQNKAFTIGSPSFPDPLTLEEIFNVASSKTNQHIQLISEALLRDISSIELKSYLRGCSAFTGFPKGCNLLNSLNNFSEEMESKVGTEAWREWGTEQFSSNVMISMCKDSSILPWPEYQNFGFPFKRDPIFGASVIHFIGSNRYHDTTYSKAANSVISKLKANRN